MTTIMPKECWINVYDYPKSGLHQSHCILDKNSAMMYSRVEFNHTRKTVYRIHVKMDGGYNKDDINKFREEARRKREDTESWLKNYSIDWQR